jgi:5'-3' exonuclease
MIIVDFNQVMLANLMVQLGNYTNSKIEESMLRHMILNSLRSYRTAFKHEFGELVIACDDTNYWRKQIFPYYKANRKKHAEDSDINWDDVYAFLSKIKAEIRENFPYKLIQYHSAEADDIIATLVKKYGSVMNIGEKILILSGDKDFIQLHVYGNVKQYDPTRKKWITHDDPDLFLKEHVIKGDACDGIPSVLCEDDYYVKENRKIKRLTKQRLDSLINNINNTDDGIKANIERNSQLIDLSRIPDEITNGILNEFDMPASDKSKLIPYFQEHKLRYLFEYLNEFV